MKSYQVLFFSAFLVWVNLFGADLIYANPDRSSGASNQSKEVLTPTASPTRTPTRTPTPTNTPVTSYRVSGHLYEFPGCVGYQRGWTILLQPTGRTTTTDLNTGYFEFTGVSNGNYTLVASPSCNPFGCWPNTPVTVSGADINVNICPAAFTPTPTRTPTNTATPTRTPTPTNTPVTSYRVSGHLYEFPGCVGYQRGWTILLQPTGRTTTTDLNTGYFEFTGVSNGNYTLVASPSCNPFGCWPNTPVTVSGADINVNICPAAFTPTPTRTPTNTPTPTPTETPIEELLHDGDVNGDGEVTTGDAQIAFLIAMGGYPAEDWELAAADCNGDGTVSAGDAQQIFYKALGVGSCVDDI